jgi:D-alanine-D-alanine ligase
MSEFVNDTMKDRKYRVGVLFGGRSSEHEVSLASAKNVMDALREAGHEVVPIGITPQGRWLPQGDAWARLSAKAAGALNGDSAGAEAGERNSSDEAG